MTPEDLLNKVVDRETFIEFVRALAAERERAMAIEKAEPRRYCVDGAHNWKNADIASFLYAALDHFETGPHYSPEPQPSWRMFAEFLYSGKIIE